MQAINTNAGLALMFYQKNLIGRQAKSKERWQQQGNKRSSVLKGKEMLPEDRSK